MRRMGWIRALLDVRWGIGIGGRDITKELTPLDLRYAPPMFRSGLRVTLVGFARAPIYGHPMARIQSRFPNPRVAVRILPRASIPVFSCLVSGRTRPGRECSPMKPSGIAGDRAPLVPEPESGLCECVTFSSVAFDAVQLWVGRRR